MAPNRKEFNKLCREIEGGGALTFEGIGNIFGQDFWMMLVWALMDSGEAARAIQGAIQRLRAGDEVVEQAVGDEVV